MNVVIAVDDFTQENGATVLVPGTMPTNILQHDRQLRCSKSGESWSAVTGHLGPQNGV
ncbi:MAG: phytanoyl-CoA dioxygenase family protein [Gammaproteobacteria bacterium]|nr:phytanoyl-CoA dioxygenase family protein [Gammaproteobacteria bacterium]